MACLPKLLQEPFSSHILVFHTLKRDPMVFMTNKYDKYIHVASCRKYTFFTFYKYVYSFHVHNSTYNEVAFNEKLAITKENLHTKYTPFTYNDVALNEKSPITKENLRIFFSF